MEVEGTVVVSRLHCSYSMSSALGSRLCWKASMRRMMSEFVPAGECEWRKPNMLQSVSRPGAPWLWWVPGY